MFVLSRIFFLRNDKTHSSHRPFNQNFSVKISYLTILTNSIIQKL